MTKRLLYLVSEDHYFWSHRKDLALEAQKAGYEVAVATRCTHHGDRIREAGLKLFPLHHLHRSSLSPFTHFLGLWEVLKIYRDFRPQSVHAVALVPLILGTLAAWLSHKPHMIGALGGLGYVFTEGQGHGFRKILKKLVSFLLRRVFSYEAMDMILQNREDLKVLQEGAGLTSQKTHLIEGAGVHLESYPLLPFPPSPPLRLAFVARLLWDKGLGELVKAVHLLRKKGHAIELHVYGLPDFSNPACIPLEQIHRWHHGGEIIWHGYAHDIKAVYEQSHISVLPSYREGLPKSLLEASACGRPVVTAAVPGCQEVVQEGLTGLLVPARNEEKLAEALEFLLKNPHRWEEMGKKGRERMEEKFSDSLIYKKTLDLYKSP